MDLPEIERHGDSWTLVWADKEVGFGIERLKESSDGLHAEVTIESRNGIKAGRLLGPVRLNLLSSESQTRFSNALAKRATMLEAETWLAITVQACAIVTKQWRDPPKTVRLKDQPLVPVAYLVPGLIPKDETTFIYGDGESAKSLLAMRIAISVQTGKPLPWGAIVNQPGNVLYVDWETNSQTVATRMMRISASEGLDLSEPPDIAYRGTSRDEKGRWSSIRSLDDEIGNLREEVSRDDIRLVVIDSIGFAVRGALTEDQPVREAMGLLRSLPCTRLVVAHISKASAGQPQGRVDPFGSAFFRNGVRSGFEVRRSEIDRGEDRIDLGLFQWKSNDDAHMKPFSLTVGFQGRIGPISIEKSNIYDIADLSTRTPISDRIANALRRASPLTPAQLADAVDEDQEVVAATLRRGTRFVQVSPGGGRGHQATWGLAA